MKTDAITPEVTAVERWHDTTPDLHRSEAFAEDLADEHPPTPQRRAGEQRTTGSRLLLRRVPGGMGWLGWLGWLGRTSRGI